VQLNSQDLSEAVEEYGNKIISLPKEGYEKIDVIEVTDSNPMEWSVYVPIFTTEEGMSDLTLELSLKDSTSTLYNIEVDNLHVL